MIRFSIHSDGVTKELLSLNPWAASFLDSLKRLTTSSRPEDYPDFIQARREATRARFFAGVAIWNAWATDMLAIKNQFEHVKFFFNLWRILAETDMANERFSSTFDAATAIFPGALNLSGASFERDVWFNHANFKGPTTFMNALFSYDVHFEGAGFEDVTSFAEICCLGSAQFRNVTFHREISFEKANFAKDAWFRGSRFGGPTIFRKARFAGEAGLGSCSYKLSTDFSAVRFNDNAGFDEARFEAAVNFDDTRFARNAWFSSAIFRGPATFDRTSFLGKMHFERIEIVLTDSSVGQQLQELIRRAAGTGQK